MKLLEVIKEKEISKLHLAMHSGIPPHVMYNAFNGKGVFYPKYRKAISTFLKMPESELFPEYQK